MGITTNNSPVLYIFLEVKSGVLFEGVLFKVGGGGLFRRYTIDTTLKRIMMAVPVNTGWVERSYSHLEMICEKRRNQMKVERMEVLMFLSVLQKNHPVMDNPLDYFNTINNISKYH